MPSKEVEARKGRTRADYAVHQEYRTRWSVHSPYVYSSVRNQETKREQVR